jgi:hypothetical protein
MAFSPDGRQFWPVLGLDRFRQVVPDLRQYQLEQTACDAITVRLVCAPEPPDIQLRMLQKVLEQALEYPYRWTWQVQATELPLTGSGKFEEFMCSLADTGPNR